MWEDIISDITDWSVELEPEVEQWLDKLTPKALGAVAFQMDRLASRGSSLRMPISRALDAGLYELRFDLDRVSWRITYFFATGRRIVALTVFRKQRMNERHEVTRARAAKARCIDQGHTAEEDD